MASIKVNTNLAKIVGDIKKKIETAANPEYLLRPICFDLIDLMTQRIHIDGKASDNGPIGTYSSGYLRERASKYKRSADTKVIVSLTRQLENDWSVIATDKGYGIGFKNVFNAQKARWVEQTKEKRIFSLSPGESEYVGKLAGELIKKALEA